MTLPRSWYSSLVLALCACATSTTWVSTAEPSAPRELEQLARARAAKDALAKALMSELTTELSERGPVAAIDVCSQRAPILAREVGQQHGVKIGRTSAKLRNERNRAPQWAEQLVADNQAQTRYFASSDGAFGVALPITMQSACTACHGADQDLDPAVKAAISARYPEDRATNFAVGDLRGWFWVEVP